MKLKMLVHLAGVDFSLAPGDVTDRFVGDEAHRLIANGFAAPYAPKRGEKAVLQPPAETRG